MESSRRNFLKFGLLSLASATILPKILSSSAFADDLPLAKESDPMPKSLGFCQNARKPTKQCADRKAKDKADQFCMGCQLYTKQSGDGEKEVGKCMLIAQNTVPAHGWCKSWVKKP